MLFLACPESGTIFRLYQEGKEVVPTEALPAPVAVKYGPHMVNLVAYFDIEPHEINLSYHDGGFETYRVLESCLLDKNHLRQFRSEDFCECVQGLGKLFNLSAPACLFVKCDQGGIYRITLHPKTGTDLVKIDNPLLFDDTRQADFHQLHTHESERYQARTGRLVGLFDPDNLSLGANSFTELFKNL